ncbi:hypothetical protein DENSPDRAFT_210298 [Dentipellis sp. KUC8613]|nr:hypothetical protein DENSPDRAFT_210298 [Dentipellis sp. KUC8613]
MYSTSISFSLLRAIYPFPFRCSPSTIAVPSPCAAIDTAARDPRGVRTCVRRRQSSERARNGERRRTAPTSTPTRTPQSTPAASGICTSNIALPAYPSREARSAKHEARRNRASQSASLLPRMTCGAVMGRARARPSMRASDACCGLRSRAGSLRDGTCVRVSVSVLVLVLVSAAGAFRHLQFRPRASSFEMGHVSVCPASCLGLRLGLPALGFGFCFRESHADGVRALVALMWVCMCIWIVGYLCFWLGAGDPGAGTV